MSKTFCPECSPPWAEEYTLRKYTNTRGCGRSTASVWLALRVVGLFTQEEMAAIRREYDFRERGAGSEDSSVFTVHNLDTTDKDESEVDLSKSQVLAPFNTNEPDGNEFIESITPLVVKKSTIKFLSKLREVNRQYERDNNSNIDNGIYVKSMAFKQPVKTALPISRTTSNQIDRGIVEEMEKMGFERDFIKDSLSNNFHNCATTCYFLLSEN
eukprot:TRINITY_DN2093_c0_g1_i11.p1 TRINITY_DN2093_c0_g1~~TRINITY_DN2093_c0_g1_i11.p1  ORF type:complete len:213 (+),score=29.98 TRINITY_DN2093_c0_g1_i11:136-774(+)